MPIYMVSYDLNRPGQDYKTVTDRIESLGTWCHYLGSTYLVKSSLNLDSFSDRITSVADSSDRFIVVEVNGPIKGWLSNDQWAWIHSNLSR